MGLPISLETNRSWLIDVMKVAWVGPIVVFAVAAAPAVATMMLFILFQIFCALFGIRHHWTAEHAAGVGLIASSPWNLVLSAKKIRVRLLWTPAWIFCLVMGAFGLVKASGLLH
jgi:hypothetical protein